MIYKVALSRRTFETAELEIEVPERNTTTKAERNTRSSWPMTSREKRRGRSLIERSRSSTSRRSDPHTEREVVPMNQRERNELDRHITGNYGEDQFEQESTKPERQDPRRRGTSFNQLEVDIAVDALRNVPWTAATGKAVAQLLAKFRRMQDSFTSDDKSL